MAAVHRAHESRDTARQDSTPSPADENREKLGGSDVVNVTSSGQGHATPGGDAQHQGSLPALLVGRDMKEEMPEDLGAFFGHPLTAATTAINGEDHQASALALLHEYQNLPAIDRADVKIGDKYDSLNDILRYVGFRWPDLPVGPCCLLDPADQENEAPTTRVQSPKADDIEAAQQDYLMLLNTDVDAFLNRDSSGPHDLSMKVLDDDDPLPQDLSHKVVSSPPGEDPLLTAHQDASPSGESSDDFGAFDPTDPEPLVLNTDIKQEVLSDSSSDHPLLDASDLADAHHVPSSLEVSASLGLLSIPTVKTSTHVSVHPMRTISLPCGMTSNGPIVTSSRGLTLPIVPPIDTTPQPTMVPSCTGMSMPPNVSVSEATNGLQMRLPQRSQIALQLAATRALPFTSTQPPAVPVNSQLSTNSYSKSVQENQLHVVCTSSPGCKTAQMPPVTLHSGGVPFSIPSSPMLVTSQGVPPPPRLQGAHRLPPPPRYEDLPQRTQFAASGLPVDQVVEQAFVPSPAKQDQLSGKGHCDPSTQPHKASDSTKKIIQALTEKLKRKQLQKQVSEQDHVSMNEITDLIQESMDRSGSTPAAKSPISDNSRDSLRGPMSAPPCSSPPSWPAPRHPTPAAFPTNWQTHSGPPTPASAPVQCSPVFRSDGSNFSPSQSQQNGVFYGDSANGVYNFESGGETSPGPFPHSMSSRPCGAASPVEGGVDSNNMVLVISPQATQTQFGSAAFSHSQTGASTYNDLKSPDSGFNETCVSPTDSNTTSVGDGSSESSLSASVGDLSTRNKVLKRRRSSSASLVKQNSSTAKPSSQAIVIPKLENDLSGYKYFIETNISTSHRVDEDRITYLNKGQFYGVTLECRPTNRILRCHTVKTVIMVVFRDEKSVGDELKSWEFWHSRQHSVKQRILDIDTKNSTGVVANSIEEIAHNAVTIRWNPREQPAKVSIAINCLSTDFSNQKGVKGLPLHVQIDTFEGDTKDGYPLHRAYCQVKVFCDKGAERKTRDEERRKEAKTKLSDINGRKRHEDLFHPPCERSAFYSMSDLSKIPILFNPMPEYEDYGCRAIDGFSDSSIDATLEEALGEDGISSKRVRRDSNFGLQREAQRVLLYVREPHEQVFTALLLQMPTLVALAHAIEEKYKVPAMKINNIYKRSRKGIMVKMDDNIIRHYSNESTFIISIKKSEEVPEVAGQSSFEVTLAEIDAETK